MARVLLLVTLLALAGCGKLPLPGLGGPNVAANVQAGKTNNQTVGTNKITEQKIIRPQVRTLNQSADENQVRAETVGAVTVKEGNDMWLIIAFAIALLLDSPLRWPEQIWNGIRKWKN